MTTNVPLVSVLMPIYNAADYVTQAIKSIWTQTHQNVEFIAIDDGSTDSSLAIVRDLQLRSPIPMTIETQANAGPAVALHRMLAQAKGEWICWLAADDFYAPEFIQRNLEYAARLKSDDFLTHCNYFMLEADGKMVGTADEISPVPPLRGQAFEQFATGNGRIASSAMFLRRDILLRNGGFNPDMIAEDCELFLRLARVLTFHYIEEPLYYLRRSPGSLGKKPWLWGEDITGALARHGDLLGDRLPHLLAQASSNVSVNCFEHGGWSHGMRWARRTVGFAPDARAKAVAAAGLALRIGRAMARNTAYRLIGRDRLYTAKRAVLAATGRASRKSR